MNYTKDVLSWLETILYERFGHAFVLEQRDDESLSLGCSGASTTIVCHRHQAAFHQSRSVLPCGEWNATREGWQSALGRSLPAPGVDQLPSPLIERTDSGYHIHYDVFGLIYWVLSRQEEVGRDDLDLHGRFAGTSSHAYKHGYLERPIVDEWLCILGQVIRRQWPAMALKQHQSSMKVSHDVDLPSRYGFCSSKVLLRLMAGSILKRGDFHQALLAPWISFNTKQQLHAADPCNTFDWLMDVSEQYGLQSAFYFICGRTDARRDADYEPEHPAIRQLMKRIHARGHEIGLHPSYNTYQAPQLIAQEAQRLRKICAEEGIEQSEWGGRMHYLRWEHPLTLQGWESAGMTYDSTLGYADLPGFRCGTCHEYPAFDPVRKKQLKVRVRPLVAMECTIMAERYMGLGISDAAMDKFLELKQACESVGGCFTLLWHNSSFSDSEFSFYERLLG